MDRVEELFGGGSVINGPTSSSFHTTRQILHYFRLSPPKQYIVNHGGVSFFLSQKGSFLISSWVLYYRQLKSGVKAHFQDNATWISIVRFFNNVK